LSRLTTNTNLNPELEKQVQAQAESQNPPGESHAHEADALAVRGILWFVIIFVIATAIVLLIVWWMYVGFVGDVVKQDEVTSALAGETRLPPEPRLQPSLGHEELPQQDLTALMKRENVEFARRGWLDEKTGKFEIPADVVTKVEQMSSPSGGGAK
jgi:hypothetical protein